MCGGTRRVLEERGKHKGMMMEGDTPPSGAPSPYHGRPPSPSRWAYTHQKGLVHHRFLHVLHIHTEQAGERLAGGITGGVVVLRSPDRLGHGSLFCEGGGWSRGSPSEAGAGEGREHGGPHRGGIRHAEA